MGYVRIRDGILDATHANRLQEAIVSGLRDRLGLQDSFGIDPPEPLPVLKIPTCPLTTLEICRIYVFADKYMMPVLKCSATDALCHALSSSQSRTHALDIIKFVGDNTPDPCGLRNVCIDFYTEVAGKISSRSWSQLIREHKARPPLRDLVRNLHSTI